MLQADSQLECTQWVQSLEKAINDAYIRSSDGGDSGSGGAGEGSNGDIDSINNDYFEQNNEINNHVDSINGVNTHNTSGILHGSKSSKSLRSMANSNTNHNDSTNEITLTAADSKRLMISSVKGNQVCCDCKASSPSWCVINLGILVCIECSGKHRGLGVHISKVRSLNLDDLDNETVQLV